MSEVADLVLSEKWNCGGSGSEIACYVTTVKALLMAGEVAANLLVTQSNNWRARRKYETGDPALPYVTSASAC